MNRRGFLAAIPGLAALSRLWGKKEAPPDLYDKVMPAWEDGTDTFTYQLRMIEERERRRALWNINPPVDEHGRQLILGSDGRIYVGDHDPWRCPVCSFYPPERPTFAELSRQWDATT